jgi:hypothetical protein
MARKGDLKAVLKMNVALDRELADAVAASAQAYERRWCEEVRYRLRQAYGLDRSMMAEVVKGDPPDAA